MIINKKNLKLLRYYLHPSFEDLIGKLKNGKKSNFNVIFLFS